jgi:hypothetical protein
LRYGSASMKRSYWLARMSGNRMMRTIKGLIEHAISDWLLEGSLNQVRISHQCFLIGGAALSGRQFFHCRFQDSTAIKFIAEHAWHV